MGGETIGAKDSSAPIAFHGAASGDDQLVKGFHASGTFERWREAVAALRSYPKAQLALYVSFVSALQHIVRAPDFITDWAGRTTTGKTTSLRVAASVWGQPDEKRRDTIIQSWNSTRVFVGRIAALLSGLPLLLDETNAADKKQLPGLIYMLANGRDKGRGNPTGIARTESWETLTLSTGEAPVTGYSQDNGTRMRVLEVAGSPFGQPNDEMSRLVTSLNLGLVSNYGHAGPAFVRWLTQRRGEWADFSERYRDRQQIYTDSAKTAEGGRLAGYMALIDLAVDLAHDALDLPWSADEGHEALHELWSELTVEAAQARGEERALYELVSWVNANRTRFYSMSPMCDEEGAKPSITDREAKKTSFMSMIDKGDAVFNDHDYWGRWDARVEWTFIAVYPQVLDTFLRQQGYSPDAVKRAWREREWLELGTDKKSRFDKLVTMQPLNEKQQNRQRMVVIRRTAVEEIIG